MKTTEEILDKPIVRRCNCFTSNKIKVEVSTFQEDGSGLDQETVILCKECILEETKKGSFVEVL
jgi:hypothetical protein